MPVFIDLHCHTSTKPEYSDLDDAQKKDLWYFFDIRPGCELINQFKEIKQLHKSSQATLQQCSDGNVPVIFNSLYPVELPWFDTPLPKIIAEKIASCMTNFDKEVIDQLFLSLLKEHEKTAPLPYFERLQNEYQLVLKNQQCSAEKNFIICSNYQEYQHVCNQFPADKKTAMILTIEGAHSLINFENYYQLKTITFDEMNDLTYPKCKNFLDQITQHITAIKSWGNGNHAPFFITFAHHFWNILCGHAQSFSSGIIDQSNGLNYGINALGKTVIDLLLEQDEHKRRILIDIKHLSINARVDFYNIWENKYTKSFPIIASHAAVAGTITALANKEQELNFFNNSDINFFDEDILNICESNGLFGIMMEQGRLINPEVLKYIEKTYFSSEDLKLKSAEIIMANMLYIVDKCGRKGWDCIALGSDFDGMINSLDAYGDILHYTQLFEYLRKILDGSGPVLDVVFKVKVCGIFKKKVRKVLFTAADVQRLKYGLSTDEIIEKISHGNVDVFLQKYFHNHYLKMGNTELPAIA